MNDQLNKGKGFLKEKLGSYQVDPPEHVWDSVSASIGGKSRRGLYLLILAGAASVALAVTLGISYFKTEAPASFSELENQAVPRTEQREYESSEPAAQPPLERETQTSIPYSGRADRLEERVAEAMVMIEKEEITGHGIQGNESAAKKEAEAFKMALAEPELLPDPGIHAKDSSILVSEQADTTAYFSLDAGEDLLQDPLVEFETAMKRDPRWMLGAVMSPLYSYRDADLEAMSGGAEYESGLVSYAGGINVSYRGNSRLAFESGIHFNKMGIAIGASGIQLFDNSFDMAPLPEAANRPELVAITNSVGNIVTASGQVIVNGYKLNAEYGADAVRNSELSNMAQVAKYGIEQHLDYLEVPFNVRYTVVDRTFELQLVGGLSTNFLVNNYVTMETDAGTADIGYLTNVRNVNYSGNAGVGMIYHLHERFSLLLEPRFRYFLNSVNDKSLPSTRPYALGIYTGISYTF